MDCHNLDYPSNEVGNCELIIIHSFLLQMGSTCIIMFDAKWLWPIESPRTTRYKSTIMRAYFRLLALSLKVELCTYSLQILLAYDLA